MNWKNFFKEGTEESFGRLLSAVFGLTAVYVTIIEVNWKLFNPHFIIDTSLIIELALIAIGGKVWSKYAEKKNKPKEDETN